MYDELQEVQHVRFNGVMTDAEKAELLPLSNSPVWPALLDCRSGRGTEIGLMKSHLPALQGALALRG